jgi:hypothetical protein
MCILSVHICELAVSSADVFPIHIQLHPLWYFCFSNKEAVGWTGLELIIDLDICEGMGELCLFYALLAAFLNFSDNCWYLIVKEVQQVTESWIILAQRSNHRMNKSSSGSSIYHSKTVSNNRMLCLVVYSLVKLSASNIIVSKVYYI